MRNLSGKLTRRDLKTTDSRLERRRRLHLESLEGRRLLAADSLAMSNALIAEDVNGDFRVSALDALLVINHLNARSQVAAAGESASVNSGSELFFDVNGDGRVSALDALRVVNRLNAEGENAEILMEFSYTITNIVSPNDPTVGTPLTQVAVGQQFQVNVFVRDSRDLTGLPINENGDVVAGVFSAGMDLGVSSLAFADYQFTPNPNPNTAFRSGILFSNQFTAGRAGLQGANIQDEYFNEVFASTGSLTPPQNPGDFKPFYSVRFTASNPGTMTFHPNGPEDPDSENLLLGSNFVIPNSNVDFGGSFSITIVADPNVPVANSDTLIVRQGANRTITNAELLINDTTVSPPLTVTGIQTTGGTQGSLVGNVYTPAPGFTGNDPLTYTISDSQGRTATGSITMNVLPQIVAAADSFTIQVDSSNNDLNVLSNDLPAAGLSITQVTTPNQGGSVTIVGGNLLRYTPAAGFTGTETFTYRVQDGAADGAFSTALVTITVIERLPAAGSFSTEVDEATQDNPIDVLSRVQPNDGQQAVLVGIGTQPAHGSVAIDDNGTPNDPTDDFVRYTPNPGFVGSDSFTYIANDTSDPQEPNSTGTVTVVVKAVNFPPQLVNDVVNTLEKQGAVIPIASLLSNDQAFLPGQNLTLTGISPISTVGGSVQIQGGNIVYTPSPTSFFGQFLFAYTATDDFVRPLSSTATVTINVAPVNDPPIVPTDIQFRGFKNVPLNIPLSSVLANILPGPPNEAGQVVSVIAVTPNAMSNGNAVGTLQLNTGAGVIVFTPNQDFTGAATFGFTVRDNGGTANGGNDTAQGQATIVVEEFLPSSIGGRVWVDENRNGVLDAKERFLAGVTVELTGTSLGQPIVPQSAVTLSDGSYQFQDLGPGSYQITFQPPAFMSPSSSFASVRQVEIVEPGGSAVQQDHAVIGLTAQYAQWVSQLVSRYYYQDPGVASRGAYFAIGSDNSLLWGMKLEGFEQALFTEAVMDGESLLLTIIDGNHQVHTARLGKEQFAFIKDAGGNTLVRILKPAADFNWLQVNRQSPPFSAANYLAAVDRVFAQSGW